jgi:hypothetical protein
VGGVPSLCGPCSELAPSSSGIPLNSCGCFCYYRPCLPRPHRGGSSSLTCLGLYLGLDLCPWFFLGFGLGLCCWAVGLESRWVQLAQEHAPSAHSAWLLTMVRLGLGGHRVQWRWSCSSSWCSRVRLLLAAEQRQTATFGLPRTQALCCHCALFLQPRCRPSFVAWVLPCTGLIPAARSRRPHRRNMPASCNPPAQPLTDSAALSIIPGSICLLCKNDPGHPHKLHRRLNRCGRTSRW